MLNEISIEIIRKCPNLCLHCSSISSKFCTEIISFEKFVGVVDDAQNLGAKVICLSGGEPFLHPDIIDIVSYIHLKGLDCYIYTSGITFDANMNYSSLSQGVLSSIAGKATKLIFNIEASDESTYNKIMGTEGCFPLLQESVVCANNLSIITEAHFVPMKLNVKEISSTILLCEKLGISKLSFLRLVIHGRALDNREIIALSDNELEVLKEQLDQLKFNTKLNIRIGVPLSDADSQHVCEAAKGKLNIKYDGHVFPCEVFKNDEVDFQINEHYPENINLKALSDIYFNSEYLQYVRSFIKKYTCSSNCERCIGQYLIRCSSKEEFKNGK